MVGGKLAVQSFFMISGFYMSLILNEKYVAERYSYRLFITNRLLRIFPLYWVVLFFSLALSVLFLLGSANKDALLLAPFLNYELTFLSLVFIVLSNAGIFGIDLTLFLSYLPGGNLHFTGHFQDSVPPVYSFMLIPQAWSLSLELYFYLIAPFFLRSKDNKLFILLLSSVFLRIFLHRYFKCDSDPWTYRFFLTELVFFILGAYSYRFYTLLKRHPPGKIISGLTFAVIVLSTISFGFFGGNKLTVFSFELRELVYLSLVFFSIPVLFFQFRNNRMDAFIGELSYPVYIVHLIIIIILGRFIHGDLLAFSGVAASILVSIILNRLVTQPIDKYRQKRVQKAAETANNRGQELMDERQ